MTTKLADIYAKGWRAWYEQGGLEMAGRQPEDLASGRDLPLNDQRENRTARPRGVVME